MVSWIPRLKSKEELDELAKHIVSSLGNEEIVQILVSTYGKILKRNEILTSGIVGKIIKIVRFFYLPLKKIKEKISR
jgi:hypothetical protein